MAATTGFAAMVACGGSSGGSDDDVTDDGGWADAADDANADPGPWVVEDLQDLTSLVDPMIGTGGPGHVIPGALVPHGMVRASPDTLAPEGRVGAYDYSDEKIEGFSHNNLEGPGGSGNGYSHIRLMPIVGERRASPASVAATYSHDTEHAEPGYYNVLLGDEGLKVELTATGHAAVHRYTFPAADARWIIFDVGHSLGNSADGEITIVDGQTIEGWGLYVVHPLLDLVLSPTQPTGRAKTYFYARISAPFAEHGTWQGRMGVDFDEGADHGTGPWLGAYAGFGGAEAAETIEVRVGISTISTEQARLNLEAEVGEAGFDQIRESASEAWNQRLNRIQVEGGDADARRVFYTALYHAMFQPADYTEAGGRFFSAADGVGEVFEDEGYHFYTDDWCVWDTFRTSHPLQKLIEPEIVGDVASSYLHLYQQGGWLPKCTWSATGYSRVMIGNHAVSLIADAVVKGFDGFDWDLAWEALFKSATSDVDLAGTANGCGYLNLGTPPDYLELGYVPTECDADQSVSMTLEYAYDDWCIARMAEATGRETERAELDVRAGNYANHWDAETGFMRPRHRDGSWVEPFDPADTSGANDFCEANSWIYSFFVPHDVPGLMSLMGGADALRARLDAYFGGGYHDASNQPGFHVAWLYNWAGDPAGTQGQVRELIDEEFDAGPGGLPGNDDSGAMSAWLVWAAMGLYPVAPGSGVYQLAAPRFDRVTIHLHPASPNGGGQFVIEVKNPAPERTWIAAAELNGATLERPWLTWDEITTGGRLELELTDQPTDAFSGAR